MERNWLIRTTQKQILGPVTKSKVIEFLDKGALGSSDEVMSGNGYWFSLKEKELVDKYLLGDLPQGFNPISESRSVLAKRENPDKTTSLNTTPISKTQAPKSPSSGSVAIPASSDLEYPDITLVRTTSSLNLASSEPLPPPATKQHVPVSPTAPENGMKLPSSDDLEFPDISKIINSQKHSPIEEIKHTESSNISPSASAHVEVSSTEDEALVYPKDDDLAYPDMGAVAKKSELKEPSINPEVKKTTSKDLKNEFEEDSGLTLDFANPYHEDRPEKIEHALSLKKEKKQEKIQALHHDDKKLLHERKVKGSAKIEAAKATAPRSPLPEHLKKRNDNYLMYILVILVLIIVSLFFYYYSTILNKPLPV